MADTILQGEKITRVFLQGKTETKVLDGIDIEIYENDFTVIMGPSGAGKSTLLYSLSGMDPLTVGHVFYKDKEISGLSENRMAKLRAEEFGFVFQQTHLVSSLTLLENVLVAGYVSKKDSAEKVRERAANLLRQMDVEEAKDRLPSQVSGGEAQRAAIARAMIGKPGLLFADEPTGALDSKAGRELLECLRAVNDRGQATILMVTHDPFSASYAKDVYMLSDGVIRCRISRGTDRKEFYDRIVDVQTSMGGDFSWES